MTSDLTSQAGLQDRQSGPRPDRLPAAITDKIVELKKENSTFGIKRISQLLRRWFFLPASPATVRQRLQEAELMSPTTPPKPRNMTRPRFFERATPNQLWQTDIFTFRLGGRYAYLIAFLDDYSRFIVGADLFRSPTAQAYYQWEQRALEALLSALTDQPTGRPKTPTDPEKQALQRRVKQLEQQLQEHEQQQQLRQLLNEWAARDDLPPGKKNPK